MVLLSFLFKSMGAFACVLSHRISFFDLADLVSSLALF